MQRENPVNKNGPRSIGGACPLAAPPLLEPLRHFQVKFAIWCVVSFVCLAFSLDCYAVAEEEPLQDSAKLILQFDMTGGQRPRRDGPILQVWADGTVSGRNYRPDQPRINTVLTQTQFEEMLAYLSDDLRILEISEVEIEEDIEAKNERRLIVMDSPETHFYADLQQGEFNFRWKGVSIFARQYPDIEQLQNAYKLQRYLLDMSQSINEQNLNGL